VPIGWSSESKISFSGNAISTYSTERAGRVVVRRSREIKIRVRAFRFGKEEAENKVVSVENR
jgi:hypothetical protein